jgi:tRNA A37 N6-isopentenylltransferase MiaA
MLQVISGPTGSGKTSVAEKCGEKLFNADAFQFYREIPILTNQPASKDGLHFFGDRSIVHPTNAGNFAREAKPFLPARGIWVGVGLYLNAVLYGLDEDRKKGTPFQGEPRVPFRMVVLNPDRKTLYHSLDQRVDDMLEAGAMEEAREIFKMVEKGEVSRANPVLKAIGLNHLIQHFEGKLNFDETLRLWKRDTRRLAKRQVTWLRKFAVPSSYCAWFDPFSAAHETIKDFLGGS